MNRVLYQFPLSHYCEKARWLLDFKDLEYSVKNLFPATHRLLTLWKANSTTVPLVKDGKEWIGDSTELAFYLDAFLYFVNNLFFRSLLFYKIQSSFFR